jgi:hypothetical protein
LEKTNCIGNLSDQISIKIERENASKFESEKIKIKKYIRSTQLLLEFVIPTAYLAQERGEEKGEN